MNFRKSILYLAIFAAGFCGMVTENSISTAMSYLEENTAAAYAVVIGTFMLSLGVGGYASQFMRSGKELGMFVLIELVLSILTAASVILMMEAAVVELDWTAGLILTFAIGVLVGLELPLIIRINETQQVALKDNIAKMLWADYLGGFLAGISFCWLLPKLDIVHIPILAGAINLGIGAAVAIGFRSELRMRTFAPALGAGALALGIIWILAGRTVAIAEQAQFEDPIIFHEQTVYQRIVITKQDVRNICLYLNGQTQFCTVDEARYHESLVHPAFGLNPSAKRILILGGGDGMAAREILKYPDTTITLVDLDPHMVELCRTYPRLVWANNGSLNDLRVQIVSADAYKWIQKNLDLWDIIFIDLPDPSHPALAKLYSVEFYRMVASRLAPDGVMVTQSTSPIHAPEVFVAIWKTMKTTGLSVIPYRTNVPTFGDWGFNLGMRPKDKTEREILDALETFVPDRLVETKYLNQPAMQAALRFEKGIFPANLDKVEASRIIKPTVLTAYEMSWDKIE
ncbi:MAG: Spermidine synthase [Candidatus Uhrbacteria bacterium GW2011_GWF2_41_16]|uniref:Polyamine aminopropyltransferase n=2 Tax=Candidatus Uhriibacteriota TaxID=1752732 RepID=A0A0G0YD27_9BACT|nr:MAG: Spermidine synthase [Candidatus Uhrbacteria bacterium GW2011_GWC2_41_11]KKR98227.1 MAG: Spermidine synthase [Candidatus Uhrbacteria bacterium GW2011_GWF2_41_16]HBP00013.1 polyamine aminopropyltransferase [Candidatus Uhrbacteria bacterium]